MYCATNLLKIHEIHKEIRSGAHGINKSLTSIIYSNKKINLILYDTTRFSRTKYYGLKLVKECMKRNINIHFVKEKIIVNKDTYEKYYQLVEDFLKISEIERNKIVNRANDSINFRKALGLCLGNKPFGFDVIDKKLIKNNDFNAIRLIIYLRQGIQSVKFIRNILAKLSSESKLLEFYDEDNVTKINKFKNPFTLDFKDIANILNEFNICNKYWIPSKIKSLYDKYSHEEEFEDYTKEANKKGNVQEYNFLNYKFSYMQVED
jgi:DNA invertase Pin-like site-specific DNA recombinase